MILPLAAGLAGTVAALGVLQCLAGWHAARRFAAQPPPPAPAEWPPVVLFKPLCGDEPLLEAALASACAQDYPCYRIVFGVQDPADAAIAVVERLRVRFPHRDIRLVIDPTAHGMNRKVGNLLNMLAATAIPRDDTLLVFVDSDVHGPPDHLRQVACVLAQPGIGLATSLYAGLAGASGPVGKLGCTGITHGFLPGVLLARALGRQDGLGTTMALRRDTLDAIGGMAALADHLADDNEMARLVRARGLGVTLTPVLTAVTVSETRLGDLLRHELRWARTIRSLVPLPFALSSIQYPLAWAMLALVASAGATWAVLLFLLAWVVRAVAARGIDQTLAHGATPAPIELLPLRDLLSVGLVVASFAGNRVTWRGVTLQTRK